MPVALAAPAAVADVAAALVAGLLPGVCVALAVVVLGAPEGAERIAARARPPAPRPADPPEASAALVLDLLAAALAAGAAPTAALAVVGDAVGGPQGADLRRVAARLVLGAEPDRAWAGAGPEHEALRRCLQLAQASGAPVAGLLREAAGEQRRAAHQEAVAAAARLGVRVVLPLGLCALPGFAALGVAPVVLGLAGSLLGG